MIENNEFERWWESQGQYCRAGGGDYEKTFAFRAWEASQKASSFPLLLNGTQVLAALELAAPTLVDRIKALPDMLTGIDDELATDIYIQHKPAGLDLDGSDSPEGCYCWLQEYPDEGALQL